jgi:hypothetical protein
VANTERDVTDVNSRTASAARGSILVFFIAHSLLIAQLIFREVKVGP